MERRLRFRFSECRCEAEENAPRGPDGISAEVDDVSEVLCDGLAGPSESLHARIARGACFGIQGVLPFPAHRVASGPSQRIVFSQSKILTGSWANLPKNEDQGKGNKKSALARSALSPPSTRFFDSWLYTG